MPCFLTGCLLFFTGVMVCAGQESRAVLDLAPGHPVSALLTPGHVVTLWLDVSGSQAEDIFFDTAVEGISYRVAAGSGTEMQSGRLTSFGWSVITISASSRSKIQVQLRTESGAEGLPGVRVRAEQFPVPLRSLPMHARAAQAFDAAQLLHRSLHAGDVRQAVARFQSAAKQWFYAGDLYGEALALGGKGESEIELSRYGDAKQTLDRSLALAGDNAYLRGWLLHLEARLLFNQWQGRQASTYAEEELRLGQTIADPALIALARTDLAGVAYWRRDITMGKIADQAHEEAIGAGTPDTLAMDQRWKAWVDEYHERILGGMSESSESATYFRRAGDGRNALDAAIEVAEAVSLNGDFYSALAAFWKLDPVVRASGSPLKYGTNSLDIGIQYRELNNLRLAGEYFRRADALYAGAHILFGRVLSHGYLCETELQGKDAAKAVPECKLSLTFARQFGDTAFIGEALCDLGTAERKAGSLTLAFADLTEAAKVTHTIHDLRFESTERIQLGELLQQQGKRQEALDQFLEAESLGQGVANSASLLEAQYSVAHWYTADGQYAKAEAELTLALAKVEAARQLVSSSYLQASYFAAERKCYELAIELRMREFARAPDEGADGLALEVSEQSRARALLDAQATAADARERGDVQASLIRSNIAVNRAFDRRLKLLVNGGARRDLHDSAVELSRALSDLERSEQVAQTPYAEAAKPAPTISTAALQQASIGSSITFFEYALGDERSYLWVIAGGKRTSYVLPPRGKLEGMVRLWRVLATGQGGSQEAGHAKLGRISADLSCALLADAVQASMTQMVIVPDGALAMLPFAALPEKGCSGAPGEPLVVGHEITSTPSLSVFFSHKRKSEQGSFHGQLAIVADPVFDAADPRAKPRAKPGKARGPNRGWRATPVREMSVALPRLLNAGYEASAIQEVVTKATGKDQVFLAQGFDATLETVLSPAMRDYRIWHLATHGVYDETMPEFSGLVFSLVEPDGSSRFGLLKAQDIAMLNVPAELIVLSACDSAAGETLNGEGVMGLSYSFLRAGARQVVATLWGIDEVKSRELMVAFYKELMRNGGNAAAALRQSQLLVMHHRRGSAPYYWAGFELTSLGEKSIPAGAK